MAQSSASAHKVAPDTVASGVIAANGSVFAGKRVHLIGIAGCGMRALASALVNHRAVVSGSDMSDSGHLRLLRDKGVACWAGHSADKLTGAYDYAVYSAAITADNPELVRLRTSGARVLKYAEMLGLLMDQRQGVAISGTHGKSTTTAMTAYVLRRAELDPSFVVGASVDQLSGASGVGQGQYFIAEACEYDRSFLNLRPHIAVILNIEEDHLDYYRDLDDILSAFDDFAKNIRPGGLAIVNGDDVNIKKLTPKIAANIETFGDAPTCHWQAHNLQVVRGTYQFDIVYRKETIGTCHLELAGLHNVHNALASAAAAYHCGVPNDMICKALGEFRGANRRMTLKASVNDVVIIDDYAHHPTEIRATIQAVREKYQPKRFWCVFQPHQHSRTRFLLDDFAQALATADVVVVPDIFFVRDSQTEQQLINSGDLVARVAKLGGTACYLPRFDQIVEYLKAQLAPGDVVMTTGAGDIWKICDELIHWLGRDRN